MVLGVGEVESALEGKNYPVFKGRYICSQGKPAKRQPDKVERRN